MHVHHFVLYHIYSGFLEIQNRNSKIEKSKFWFLIFPISFSNFQKTEKYMIKYQLMNMHTKFQIDISKNGWVIAFKRKNRRNWLDLAWPWVVTFTGHLSNSFLGIKPLTYAGMSVPSFTKFHRGVWIFYRCGQILPPPHDGPSTREVHDGPS